MRRPELTGLVLCGGKSTRMGFDKASLELSGRTLLERAAATFEEIAVETLLACGSTPRYAELGLPLVLDAGEGRGPLAGLEAGLAHARTEWVAALACDMPRASPRAFEVLQEFAIESGLDLCLLRTDKGVEPLFAVYNKSCLHSVRAALAAGEGRITSFHAFPTESGHLPRVGAFPESGLPADLGSRGVAANLNTPEELLAETGVRESA